MNLKPMLVLFFVISVVGCNSSKNSSTSTQSPTAIEDSFAEERADCTDVDLQEKFGAIRNQGQTNFCYAFASADLLGAELNLPPPDMVSAYDLITNYISMDDRGTARANAKLNQWGLDWVIAYIKDSKRNLPLMDRGAGSSAILLAKAIADGKVCLEADLPSQEMDYEKQYYYKPLDGFINRTLLEDAGISKKDYITHHQDSAEPSIDLSTDTALDAFFRKNIIHFDSKKIEIAPSKYLPIVSDWEAMRARSKALSRCQKFQDISQFRTKALHYSRKSEELFKEDVNYLLGNNKPFIILYDACALVGNCEQSMNHLSVVIGRHWNEASKQCKVKIRNSWGRSCSTTVPGVDCDEGNYFIDIKKLAQYSWEIDFLYQ
jgi:hypothetical protein